MFVVEHITLPYEPMPGSYLVSWHEGYGMYNLDFYTQEEAVRFFKFASRKVFERMIKSGRPNPNAFVEIQYGVKWEMDEFGYWTAVDSVRGCDETYESYVAKRHAD